MTVHICLDIVIDVVANFTYIFARSIVGNCSHYNDIIHGIKSVGLNGENFCYQGVFLWIGLVPIIQVFKLLKLSHVLGIQC